MSTLRFFLALSILLLSSCTPQAKPNPEPNPNVDDKEMELARKNLTRAMSIVAAAKTNYFTTTDYAMSRYYNPFTKKKSDEKASVWMYTSAIEAVNAILHGFVALKETGDDSFYNNYFQTYKQILDELVENLKW